MRPALLGHMLSRGALWKVVCVNEKCLLLSIVVYCCLCAYIMHALCVNVYRL